MKLTPSKINTFLFFKLPSAYIMGVRVKSISESTCLTTVTYRWINQNPFSSMFWAVQGMAAELSTGTMVMAKIKQSGKNISMLVAANRATFHKKATGKIQFLCNDGHLLDQAVERAIRTKEGQTIWMKSEGTNSSGEVVSVFEFEWTIKLR
ncbi:DUF4442 domain-containing protein [Aequorivita sp. H23M31]|uniref:DUF4442 domain-containing protein n=1 Tax=Aequorivita ciconiae TaxID=2494375 RepID=A0A410G6W3_9FLAO|nr:DUF4442 domain-containing protein [Aequorivita sp. H23M31]QAA83038.1 DUF4442 domain-containing protein [Aequorivita sp. H23M31]